MPPQPPPPAMPTDRPAVVPVNLGCCPGPERCRWCPPPPPVPSPDTVAALVDHVRTERAKPGQPLVVHFFGGAPPPTELLAIAGATPVSARVRPDLLSRAKAAELRDAGVHHLELDAWTLHDPALRAMGRAYRARVVREQIEGLSAMGFELGVVLMPGLPETDHARAVADAREVAGLGETPAVQTARIHPLQVLAGSALREDHAAGRYRPLELGEAVTTSRAMVEVLDEAGVRVLRVGLQAGPDGFGRAIAGPRHPAFRQLVDARRTLAHLRDRVGDAVAEVASPARPDVTVRCAPADETVTRGPYNQHIRTLRAELDLASLTVAADPELPRGTWSVDVVAQESR